MEVKRTERGWGAHFICASRCKFRRNTLIEYGDKKWVVSTVGAYCPINSDKLDTIGNNRYYETKAFEAELDRGYWEGDVSKPIYFDSGWQISHCEWNADGEANDMHEAVVAELMEKIKEI